ncbi:GapS4b family protein [Acinetobacter calcoaceticus]|uniref:GapS4b family protein n=1 Tax=Acinetobacter calcoaceticus TaxID=471 RepID=UPI0005E5E1BC|nr:hypothetical protein [Acinetobacter calcoaceticus]KJH56950.1 hypothetical protein UF12_13685 [Acinetobacter calcoaceticus]
MSFEQLDTDSVIPSGNDLRILLNSDHISYGEIHKLLQEKGIYIGESDKSVTVPLLSSTLLLPDEFSRLIEASINRELKPKNKNSSVELLNTSKDWTDPIRNLDFSDDLLPHKGLDITQFSYPPFVEVESKKSVKITYSITSKKYNEDWIKSELTYDAEIKITNIKGKLKLDFYSTHTSKETESINRNIIRKITTALYTEKIIDTENLNQICFKSFNNQERVRFFKRLTAGLGKKLSNGDVDNIEITFDQSKQNLPDDPKITWMKNTVKKLKIDGEKLHEIFLISDDMYYDYYYIQKMDIEYPFKIGANNGSTKICFFFSAPSKKEEDFLKGELTFSFIKTSFDLSPNKDAKIKIHEEINIILQNMIEKSYQNTLTERNARFQKHLKRYEWTIFNKKIGFLLNHFNFINLRYTI